MTAATGPRSGAARLLAVDADGAMSHHAARDLPALVRAGDVVVANDAATLPASLTGRHEPTGAAIEVRLAGARTLAIQGVRRFVAVVFGGGDHRTPTEHRPLPPPLATGDRLRLGPLGAVVEGVLDHPRLIALCFEGALDAVWDGIARHGRPIQYAHVAEPLPIWSTWTRIASLPVAFEPPSAGFVLDWATVQRLRHHGATLATLTHAAGISSTGDPALDARLPFDEPYVIPAATARAIEAARVWGGRIIAVGTTVVRALEHAALPDGRVRAGDGIATGRLGPDTRLRVADVILSGTHEPGTSHYELLRAFQRDERLAAMTATLEAQGYQTHEFGDFVLLAADLSRSAAGRASGVPAAVRGAGRAAAPARARRLVGSVNI
jgi:S-adenosylmethionine:tRNA ribosyltransferase-isomerase